MKLLEAVCVCVFGAPGSIHNTYEVTGKGIVV